MNLNLAQEFHFAVCLFVYHQVKDVPPSCGGAAPKKKHKKKKKHHGDGGGGGEGAAQTGLANHDGGESFQLRLVQQHLIKSKAYIIEMILNSMWAPIANKVDDSQT